MLIGVLGILALLPIISGKILATLLQGNTLVDKRKKITFKYMYLIVKFTILIYLCIILFPGQTCGYIVQPDNGAGYVQDNVRPLDPCYARQWPVGTRVRFACLEGYERQGAFKCPVLLLETQQIGMHKLQVSH